MKKNALIRSLFVVSSFILGAQEVKQGFDDSSDNWQFSSNIPFYSKNNGTDLWNRFKGANGRVPGSFSGPFYLAGRDLDNDYSEAITGLSSPEHILTFEPIAINGLETELSFRAIFVGLDAEDYMYYEVAFDNENDWTTVDYREDIFKTSQIGNFNSNGWKQFSYTVPSGHQYVKMRLVIYQNGNAYLGFDDFELKMKTLSLHNNTIEGLAFEPNPVRDHLTIKANGNLTRVTIYNVLGNEVLSAKGSTKTMEINLAYIASGLYVVRVESVNGSQSFKIVKE